MERWALATVRKTSRQEATTVLSSADLPRLRSGGGPSGANGATNIDLAQTARKTSLRQTRRRMHGGKLSQDRPVRTQPRSVAFAFC